MKKILTLFFALAASVGTMYTQVQIGDLYYNLDASNQTAEVASGDYANITTVNIPSSVTYYDVTYDVTSIGQSAFYQKYGLISATIPNSVTKIGNYAFGQCKSLSSMTIPNNVTDIGYGAFLGCTGLTSITIPNNVTSIEGRTFKDCTALASLKIGNSVQSIGDYAFENCISLTSVTIPNSVTNIGDNAFQGCSNLASLKIGNSVAGIGRKAFENCISLTSVTIPQSVTYLGQSAFDRCSNLTTAILEAETPINQNSYVFGPQCAIYVPCGSLNAYQSEWFYYKSQISYAPLGFTVMGDVYPYTMGEVIVPLTICDDTLVTAVPYHGFHFVKWSDGNTDNPRKFALTKDTTFIAEFAQNASGKCGRNLYWEINDGQLSITGSGDMYSYDQNTVPWSLLKSEIKTVSCSPEMTSISDYAFSGINTSKFNTIILPTNLVSIGAHAFDGDSFLETVDFGANLETIGNYAFKGCKRILTMTSWAEFTPNVEKASLTDISDYAELYVLNSAFRKFQLDDNWNRFILKEIGATKTTEDVTETSVVPDNNSVVVVWLAISEAATYELVIKDKSGNIICTFIFGEDGKLISIAFNAPRRNAMQQTQSAGFSFTVTGLDSGTAYDLMMTSKNSNGATLQTETISFVTSGPQALDNIADSPTKFTKLIHEGQIYILRGDNVYTVTGQVVK